MFCHSAGVGCQTWYSGAGTLRTDLPRRGALAGLGTPLEGGRRTRRGGHPPWSPLGGTPPRPVTEGGSRHPSPWRPPWPSRRGGSPPLAAPGGGPRQNLQGGHPPRRIYRGGSPRRALYISWPDGVSQQPLRPLNRRTCESAARGSRLVLDNQATPIPAILGLPRSDFANTECLLLVWHTLALDECCRCDQLALTSDRRHPWPSQALRQVTEHIKTAVVPCYSPLASDHRWRQCVDSMPTTRVI